MSLTTSAHWMYSSGGALYDYEIEQASRWQGDTSNAPYFRRNLSINRQKWTCSFWYKRCEDDRSHRIMESLDDQSANGNYSGFLFQNDGKFHVWDYSGGYRIRLTTAAKFNDPATWYHFVVRFDSTQSTASNRVRLYVNGEQISFVDYTTYPSQNLSGQFGNGTSHYWGRYPLNQNSIIHGYMADVILADGQSYGPEEFGETKSGIWIPKDPSITYGSGGFRIDFSNASSMGTDVSGNSNNWTAYNWGTHDQVLDTPTNNFPTNREGYNQTASEGNLRFERTSNANNHTGNFPNMCAKTGKWYCELRMIDSGIDTAAFAVVEGKSYNEPADNTAFQYTVDNNTVTDGKGYYSWIINAKKTDGFAQSETSYGTALTANVAAIIMCALDLDNGKVWWGKDGTWFNSGNPAAGTNAAFTSSNLTDSDDGWGFASSLYMGRGNAIHIFNYGQDSTFAGNETAGGNADANGYGDFKYSPPSGFLAMCSANLPDPAIDPANDDTPEDYFDTVLYTAASSNGTYNIGNASFVPDFTWIKNRNNVEEHYLFDVVRGNSSMTNKFLRSNNTAAEGAGGVTGTTVTSQLGGMQVVESSINSGELYFNSRTYVMWNWKAGGTGVSNTDGSITSTVSANTDAGFSVVTYTGNGTNTSTIGHGLSSAPEFVIVKSRSNSRNWVVEHNQGKGMYLNLTNDGASAGSNTMTQQASTIRFDVSNDSNRSVNFSGETYVAYCFHSVDGFSKIGSYIGNGSSDGSFVYTGFRPAWVVIKRYDSSNNWNSHDNKRGPYNVNDWRLYLNLVSTEDSGGSYGVDFLSNGFKVRTSEAGWNASGGTYIYLVFAEQPFKYANAR